MGSRRIRGPQILNSTRVSIAAGNIALLNEAVIVVNKTSGAATTVTLPVAPVVGRVVTVIDGKGDAATNNITVAPAAGTIGGAASFVISSNYGSAVFVYNGTEWNVTTVSNWNGANLSIPGQELITGVISPTALSGDVNNYAPTGLAGASVLRIDPNGAARNITGLTGGVAGRMLMICNISTTATQDLVLKHQSGSSSAANRFLGANAADVTVRAAGAVRLWYDGTSTFWRVIAI